jgi:hypothetical protein
VNGSAEVYLVAIALVEELKNTLDGTLVGLRAPQTGDRLWLRRAWLCEGHGGVYDGPRLVDEPRITRDKPLLVAVAIA